MGPQPAAARRRWVPQSLHPPYQTARQRMGDRMAGTQRRRILSGVQPSGKLHLGNYFGAIQQHIALQDQGEAFYFIADYHALTTTTDAATLRENVRDVALDYLA